MRRESPNSVSAYAPRKVPKLNYDTKDFAEDLR